MDFLYSFFIDRFVSLGTGLASAEGAADVVGAIDGFVWGPILIILLLGTHIFMTIRTRFIQRKIPLGIKMSFKGDQADGDVTPFQALTTSLAATIGTGNIIGVGTALIAGGPGAIMWMWLTGVFGIATKYSEVFIGVKYRVKDHNGEMLGGAMYALERGFKNKVIGRMLAGLFALFAAIASFGIGAAVQSNAVAGAFKNYVDGESMLTNPIPVFGLFDTSILQIVTAVLIVILVAIVILGGIKVISRVCERLIPFMTIFYVLGCLILIIINGAYFFDAIALIVTAAFSPRAMFGGALASVIMVALQKGCARGLFSNESGLGSAPLVAAGAQTKNPARQALISMTGTFWDTVVVCALTGIALVTSILANPDIFTLYTTGAGTVIGGDGSLESATLVMACFNLIPLVGKIILCVGLALFAYTTILGWSWYGNRCITYLLGKNAIFPYQCIYLAICFMGAIGVSGFVWDISDITNGLMAIPNLIAVLGLSGVIAAETKHYVWDGNLDELDETPIPVYEDK